MRTLIIAAAALLAPAAAFAQDVDTSSSGAMTASLRGFRAEGNVGYDRFRSLGEHNNKLGYGATVGFDGQIGDRIVIGPEGSYWTANNGSQNCAAGVIGGTVCSKSFKEWGAAVRAGYLVTPNLLVFGKGGYVSNQQRKFFVPAAGSGQAGYYNRTYSDGYQAGGGVEYTLAGLNMLPVPVYVSAQYVWSRYDDHTSRQRLMGGIGVRFK